AFPEDEGNEIQQDSAVAVSIAFRGPFSGFLSVTVSKQVLPELTANILGVDEEETTSDQQHDALKETINIICGNLLPAIFGKQLIFDIDPPKIISSAEAIKKKDESKTAPMVKLALDNGQCDLLLFVDGQIPEDAIVSSE
ncbi:MAG: chemotaxis protein CheX, partial [Deltaproteobacteria bacterium]|nr:chemotaxis protein CheX [Deltaproteobacteria bacterium]